MFLWREKMQGDKRPIENEGSFFFNVARENQRYMDAIRDHLNTEFKEQSDAAFWEWLELETGVQRI